MVPCDKRAPVPDEASKTYFDGARKHELILQRCSSCGAVMWPVKMRCDTCLGTEVDWFTASGKGTLYSYALVHQVNHPGFAAQVPYNVSLVELSEGLRIVSNVVGCPDAELEIGIPIEVTFEDVDDQVSIPKFRPA